MNIEPNQKYYHNNTSYSEFLDGQSTHAFDKYVDIVNKYAKSSDFSFLDVGCGTGIALELLSKRATNSHIKGIEINQTSVDMAKSKGLNVQLYDGHEIPFPDSSFNAVGSVNVIEHVDNVDRFLEEKLRVLKPGGHLVIACPNFLSVTNGYHWHTSGVAQKMENLATLVKKYISNKHNFEKMETVHHEVFQPDDDACNIINPVDLINWAKKNKLEIVYWSSQLLYTNSTIINIIDKTFLKALFGACLFVFKKGNE